jgi:hypothetical protein
MCPGTSLTEVYGRVKGNIVKPVLGCLGPVLAAMEPGEWPAAVKSFNLLVRLVLDGRPKVRKAAQSSLLEVLATIQRTPAAASGTDAIHRGAGARHDQGVSFREAPRTAGILPGMSVGCVSACCAWLAF